MYHSKARITKNMYDASGSSGGIVHLFHFSFVPLLSVIIPTHRRPQILRQCLQHLTMQTIASDLEVIVVSDGVGDSETEQVVRSYSQLNIYYYEVEKSQQGIARNFGVKHAHSPYVLFIGDDIFLDPDACSIHLRLLQCSQSPMCVLGFTTWDPTVGITPIMIWLEQSGWQFGYPFIKQYSHHFLLKNIQHQFSYASHISLPLEIAKKFPFRSDLLTYGWEDIEWGMRLSDADIKLFYEPDAKALHHHHVELSQSLQRMETLGKSAKQLTATTPSFDRVPKGLKLFFYFLASFLPTMAGRHRRSFLKGFYAKK